MSEKIPFVDRFGDAFKTGTLTERNLLPARRGLRRFTSGWRLFVVVTVVLAGGGAAVAATKLLSVNSGQYVRSPPAAGYRGEILNIGAHNALSVGMRDTRNIQFAPGYSAWHRGVIQVNLADPSGQGPVGTAVTSTGALHAMVVTAATCSWAHYWVTSMRAGNSSAAATATRQIQLAPTLLREEAIGGIQPNGLGPTIDAIKAGDVNLVRGMIDGGGMIGDGSCNALGPTAVIPAGMSRQQYHAKLVALTRTGMTLLLSDPAALKINDQVMHSSQMGAAIGRLLELIDPPLAAKLAQQVPTGGEPLATRIGEQLIRDHPLRFSMPRNTGPAGEAHQTPSAPEGLGGIAIGAELLGIPTHNLPKTLTEMQTSHTDMRIALQLAQHVLAVDPVAEVLNVESASS
jgi:hypothetical protein